MAKYSDDATIRVIRAPHDKDRPYFSFSRATAQDRSLSFEARGVLVYLLSKPSDWRVLIADLEQNCGRDKVYRILRELREARYLLHERCRQPDGKFTWGDYRIYEQPFPEKPDTAEPDTAEPDTAEPDTAKPDSIHSIESLHNRDSDKKEIPTENRAAAAGETEVFKVYHEEIGIVSAMTRDFLKEAVAEYGADWCMDAIREAVLAGVRKPKYMASILVRWKREGRGAVRPAAGSSAAYDPGHIVAIDTSNWPEPEPLEEEDLL